MSETKIYNLSFDEKTPNILKDKKFGTNWPVVYILNDANDAYVGETIDVSNRSSQHLKNEERNKLKQITIIGSNKFNKSATLDLESFLIRYMSADSTFKLLNNNGGLRNHSYYEKEEYYNIFKNIWKELKDKNLVKKDLSFIENSDLFKFSPYKELTHDQNEVANNILFNLLTNLKENKFSYFFVNGAPGTGKTILAIYLIKFLMTEDKYTFYDDYDYLAESLNLLSNIKKHSNSNLKIGLVIPMANLRMALKKVFNKISNLNPSMVLSPNDVVNYNGKFDLLIVDEAHRLRQRKNLTNYKVFDTCNKKLNLDKYKGTELDWILKKSNYQIFFYDASQSIKKTDVPKERFDELFTITNSNNIFSLKTQLRCVDGGEEYIDFVKNLFSNNNKYKPDDQQKNKINNYDLKIVENIKELIDLIKIKNKEVGLSRIIAGYAWEWKTKNNFSNLNNEEKNSLIKNSVYDIEIDGLKFIWNTQDTDWINSPNSINEIGCIHTIQGFDLNYTGLIIGNELKYNPNTKKIYVDRNNYFDAKGKAGTSDEDLLNFILNIYSTMATRGILGTYLYVCDRELRNYLTKYIDVYKK